MVFDLSGLPLAAIVAVFLAAALAILYTGPRLAATADAISQRTRTGQAMIGALLLGATTSLPGIVTSVATAGFGYPELSISNAIGGITAQTAFLGVADIAYRRANLEHAAASLGNLTYGTLLITLLSIPLVSFAAPDWTLFGVHPASVVLILTYVFGTRLSSASELEPMWQPRRTDETERESLHASHDRRTLTQLFVAFAVLGAMTALAGFAIAESGVALSRRTGLSQTAIGGLLTAVATSLPELVTAVAAVRRGALSLAVGDIVGGNAFDVLFLAFADIAYRDGSLYHAFNDRHVFVMSVAILMTSVLLLGLLKRERHGFGGIGFESTIILLLYAASVVVLVR